MITAAGELHFEGIKQFFYGLTPASVALFVLPFVLLLGCLAILPLVVPCFWEKNKNKAIVSLGLGLPVAGFFLYQDWHTLANTLLDYAAFIALLSSLFIISGGIYIRGSFAGLPAVNALFLLTGALLANFIGTTGASMLMIRPLLRANKARHHKSHIVIFFIFVVSNCAGLLTPLGDPPLFLGFLKGIDFAWTLRLWREWLLVNGILLAVFFFLDNYWFHREHLEIKNMLIHKKELVSERFGIEGVHNFAFLAGVVLLIFVSGYAIYPMGGRLILGEPFGAVMSKVFQIIGMAMIALLSFKVTAKATHEKNHFSFGPILEVAVLFAGIFMAMVPALLILETQGSKLGVNQTWQFYWMSGALSSFLDNAPTYLTFTSLAKGVLGLGGEGLKILMQHPQGALYLAAISCGSVMMGANTYIGNGPNFMVKAIAEDAKVKMPSFFGYMAWSGAILIPIFIAVTFIFFRQA